VSRIGVMKIKKREFNLEELCVLVGMNKRKVRYYIQKELVDRPVGTGKGAHYTHRHLEQLLTLRKWKEAGLSLDRIQELLSESKQPENGQPVPPPRAQKPGSLEVWSKLYITDGVELHIEPQRSKLTPEQVRALCRAIVSHYQIIKAERE
jgi:DNA-binding transcriptional MerR regulator